ncbi:hypothetical protein MuYL_2165 [Mucilaginibacter xinganensis]|uniref:Uncharacterized protein n=2 Tax=Mucilaginibacter xinganensis TaxID=1234841 RepID=A0A223NW01_9SPHI|nr:hypothetical protein MuYL_2165 [Mucilaginibacter xinganensis]
MASHFIGFNKNRAGVFKVYSTEDGEFIAHSFQQIVDKINSNSDLIY